MNDLLITNMTLDDFYSIENIYNTHFDTFWNTSTLKSELENENSQCIIAKLNSEVVGFASIWYSVDDAHVTNIAVHVDYRKQNIGSKLIEELIRLAKEHNKSSLTLEVNTKNTIAQKLYLKYGFINLGTRKKYYKGVEDAYIMTLKLT